MKYILSLLFTLFALNFAYSQAIKVSLHPLSPHTFYEGEDVEIVIIVENTSKDSIPCNLGRFGGIVKVIDEKGNAVLNDNYEGYQSFKRLDPNYEPDKAYYDKFPPKSKMQIITRVNYFFNTNTSLIEVMKLKNSQFEYLKAGKYVLHCDVSMKDISQVYQYPVTVLPLIGEIAYRFKEFALATNLPENNILRPSADDIGDTLQPTLMQFIYKYKTGPYISTAHIHAMIKGGRSSELCLTNSTYLWMLLDLIPQIYKGKEWMSNSWNFKNIIFDGNLFCTPIDGNQYFSMDIINAYLKKVEFLSYGFSKNIIADLKNCCNCDRTQLINYALLREQQEAKLKKK